MKAGRDETDSVVEQAQLVGLAVDREIERALLELELAALVEELGLGAELLLESLLEVLPSFGLLISTISSDVPMDRR